MIQEGFFSFRSIYKHIFLIEVIQLYDFDNMEYFKEYNFMRLD